MESDQMQIEKSKKSVTFQDINLFATVSHSAISKDFINKFSNSLIFGLGFVNCYFEPNVLCSLYIYHSDTVDLFETTSYINLQNKLSQMGILTFKYINTVPTSQPVLSENNKIISNNILISLVGQVSINDKPYSFQSTFILRKKNSEYLISNYILQIFY